MHTMELIHDFNGTEEWVCPTCGRRMTITWSPWKKVVTVQGDINVAHSGGKGGLKFGSVQIMQGGQEVISSSSEPIVDDPYLAPWQRWMNGINMDDLWNQGL